MALRGHCRNGPVPRRVKPRIPMTSRFWIPTPRPYPTRPSWSARRSSESRSSRLTLPDNHPRSCSEAGPDSCSRPTGSSSRTAMWFTEPQEPRCSFPMSADSARRLWAMTREQRIRRAQLGIVGHTVPLLRRLIVYPVEAHPDRRGDAHAPAGYLCTNHRCSQPSPPR